MGLEVVMVYETNCQKATKRKGGKG